MHGHPRHERRAATGLSRSSVRTGRRWGDGSDGGGAGAAPQDAQKPRERPQRRQEEGSHCAQVRPPPLSRLPLLEYCLPPTNGYPLSMCMHTSPRCAASSAMEPWKTLICSSGRGLPCSPEVRTCCTTLKQAYEALLLGHYAVAQEQQVEKVSDRRSEPCLTAVSLWPRGMGR